MKRLKTVVYDLFTTNIYLNLSIEIKLKIKVLFIFLQSNITVLNPQFKHSAAKSCNFFYCSVSVPFLNIEYI